MSPTKHMYGRTRGTMEREDMAGSRPEPNMCRFG